MCIVDANTMKAVMIEQDRVSIIISSLHLHMYVAHVLES